MVTPSPERHYRDVLWQQTDRKPEAPQEHHGQTSIHHSGEESVRRGEGEGELTAATTTTEHWPPSLGSLGLSATAKRQQAALLCHAAAKAHPRRYLWSSSMHIQEVIVKIPRYCAATIDLCAVVDVFFGLLSQYHVIKCTPLFFCPPPQEHKDKMIDSTHMIMKGCQLHLTWQSLFPQFLFETGGGGPISPFVPILTAETLHLSRLRPDTRSAC